MAVVLEIIDLLECRKIHGCGCVADNPAPRKSTTAPFHCAWDGHGALLALKSQHDGKAIYDQLVKEVEDMFKNRQWSGMTSTTLQQHRGLHWKVYITLTECAELILIEVPDNQARVTYLLNSFKTIKWLTLLYLPPL
jgi:hypothetical protein